MNRERTVAYGRRKLALGGVTLAVALACGCGGEQGAQPRDPVNVKANGTTPDVPRVTPDAPFRQKPPAAAGDISFTPPKVDRMDVGGVRVWLVERHELPIVSVRFVFKGGIGGEAAAKPGRVAMMADALELGTKKHTALELSDAFDDLGAEHATWASYDEVGIAVKVWKKQAKAAFELAAEIARESTFPDAEIERLKKRTAAQIASEKDDVGSSGRRAIARAVYGAKHPFGHAHEGLEREVEQISAAELRGLFQRIVHRGRVTVIVAGDVTRAETKEMVEGAIGNWRTGAMPTAPPKPAKARAVDSRLVWVDKPGSAQSQIVLAEPGVGRKHPDRDAIMVMNAILGGMFSSRINLNLREKHGYTYGARSYFTMRRGGGPFVAGGAIFADKTIPAAYQLIREVERIRQEKVTVEELEEARANLKLSLPSRFETAHQVTGALADLAVYDLPDDEYSTYAARIDKVTADDVLRVAKANLDPEKMTLVIVGDFNKLGGQAKDLGWGEPVMLDAYGEPIEKDSKPTAKPAPKKGP